MTVLFDMATHSGGYATSLTGALVPTYNLPPSPIVFSVAGGGAGSGGIILEPNGVAIPSHGFGTVTTVKATFAAESPTLWNIFAGFRIPTSLSWGDELIMGELNPTSPSGGGGGSPAGNAFIYAMHHDHSGSVGFAGTGRITVAPDPSPLWLRLLSDASSPIYTIEIWDHDPTTGGAPIFGPTVYAGATGDSGFGGLFTGDAVPHLEITSITGGAVTLEEWRVTIGPERTPDTITVGANPKSIPADGTSTSDVTAYVRDHTGAGVAGLAVAFTPADHFLGAVTDNGDGTYDTTYTSSVDPGSVEVQAKTGSVSATTAIQQRPQGELHAGPAQVGIVRRN